MAEWNVRVRRKLAGRWKRKAGLEGLDGVKSLEKETCHCVVYLVCIMAYGFI